jgi:uncharacterized membrane protein (UPF0182 family)
MVSTKHLPGKKGGVLQWLLVLVGLLALLDLVTFLGAEGLWFRAVGYWQVFNTRLWTQGELGLLAFGSSIGFLWLNLWLAHQHAWTEPEPVIKHPPLPVQMGLRWLFPLTLCLSLVVSTMLLYYGQIAISHWHPTLTLDSPITKIPIWFRLEVLGQIGQQVAEQLWQLGLLLGLTIALLVYPVPCLNAIAVLMSLSFGLVLSEHWAAILPFFKPTPFAGTDPLFGRNISFYIFKLPVWELLEFWLVGLFTLTLISVSLIYLLSGNSLSQGKFLGFSPSQQRHLYFLGGCFMVAAAFSHWLDRYKLLYSPRGIIYGASYTNIMIQLPVNIVLSILAVAIALLLFWQVIFCQNQGIRNQRTGKGIFFSRFIGYLIWLYFIAIGIGGLLLPMAVQQLIVQPNELQLETPYIERTIALTRAAFDLDEIDEETFDPQSNLTYTDIQENELTVKNIRLWDTRPLLETNRQLQRIRPYYEFPSADIDRYTLRTETGEAEQQQVLIAARELDYNSVPEEAKTWVNEHLIYTHGYGFTLSPVNVAGEGGLPDYFVRGIEMIVSSDRIRHSIPINKPRIYYGELTNTYVMTQTLVRELDYPSGSENVYNTYDGRGGVSIGNIWQRLLFAKHLRDWRMLFTENFTPQTRLLLRRNIVSRVRAIAPFLRYDSDPYLVVADASEQLGQQAASTAQNSLYWMIDAYTVSDRYPYSDPLSNDFNYIRNSIKVVVDAYHGSIHFYVVDERDPIIKTWSRIFPGMFQPLRDMPVTLQAHIRYPQDFFRVQSEELMIYHMTDPQVFYNREDQWRAPNEVYADEPQVVAPYYLIMKLPAETQEEFILLRPYTPAQRTNLIAWLAARSDRVYQATQNGHSGKMLLYRFPKQELVYGPEQLEARINQDPIISQRISLWNRRGSRAAQGNLLIIPIEQSLLYVEPLYLEATINRLPTLARVISGYENRIVMAETLNESLRALFQPATDTEPIIRSIEEDTPLLEEEGLPLLEGAP